MSTVRIRSIMNLIGTPTMLFTPCAVIAAGFAGQDWNPYTDPVTGVVVQRLIACAAEDEVVYYTHPMWTQQMRHLIFDSKREGQKKSLHTLRLSDKAVVQVAPVSSGYGVLARKSNRFYYLYDRDFYVRDVGKACAQSGAPKPFASLPDNVKGQAGGMSLGVEEKSLYLGVTLQEENRWALMALDLDSGKWRTVTILRFQIGHIQASPYETGRIMFCHETGGFATQRTWVIREGDFAPKPMFKAPHDYWVTHESWWAKDKIVFTVWPYDHAHKKIPHGILSATAESDQATEHARYRAWHTHGSPDGQWIVGDDFDRNIWLVKVATNERRLLSQGHKSKEMNTHPHPSFTPDSKAVIFNSSRDGQANIFLIELPDFAALGMALPGPLWAASGFAGAWCLTSPSGGAVWLKVEEQPDGVSGRMMWEIGGVNPIKEIRIEGETLIVEQPCFHWYMSAQGMRRDQLGYDTLRATVAGDVMTIALERVLHDGTRLPRQSMSGKRAKPRPPKPDMAALRFGPAVVLFNGSSLDGWQLTNPKDNNAWSAKDGILVNNPQLEEGGNPKQFGNLRTEREFEDFRLQLEVRLPERGNSGIYLRGRYEVQVTDAYGRKPSWGNLGGVYGRIVPLENAAKPAGQWQRFDMILADRHVTVRLNDRLVIDNQFLEGCTGGALDSDDEKSGPIYFQGDHTFIEYRNIVLSPRVH